VDALRARVRQVMEGPVPVSEVSDRDAALVALATAAELRTVASSKERRLHAARIDELAERGGAAAPALRKVIQEVRTAVVVAATTATATASTTGS
jgi:hypothetical protein